MSESSTLTDKPTLPEFASLDEAADFFDTHDMSEYMEAMPEVHFDINRPHRKDRFAVEAALAAKLREAARQRGVAAEALLNEWVREKTEGQQVMEPVAVGAAG